MERRDRVRSEGSNGGPDPDACVCSPSAARSLVLLSTVKDAVSSFLPGKHKKNSGHTARKF